MKTDLRYGSTVELCVDAHAIPAGSYMYVGQMGDFLLFSIGKDVLFGVAEAHWKPFLRSMSGAAARRTSREEFLRRYYERLECLQPAPLDPNTFTFCALSSRARKADRRSRGRERLAA
jgi:hypothetical protein